MTSVASGGHLNTSNVPTDEPDAAALASGRSAPRSWRRSIAAAGGSSASSGTRQAASDRNVVMAAVKAGGHVRVATRAFGSAPVRQLDPAAIAE